MRKAIAWFCAAEDRLISATGRNIHSVLAARRFSVRGTLLIIPLALLAAAGTAGCGAAGTSGSAASLPQIAASGTAGPAGGTHARPTRARNAEAKLPAARHQAGGAPASHIPVAFAHPALLTPRSEHEVHGSSVTAVGEIGLGTNGTVTTEQIRQLIAEIGPDRHLVLVNTFEARPWEAEVNATLADAARRYQDVVLANWHKTIENRTYLLSSDGIHPQPGGTIVYARMVNSAVQLPGNLSG